MSTRTIALVILGLLFGFIAIMASVSLFVRDPLPILAPNRSLTLDSAEIAPPVRSTVMIDGGYQVEVTIEDAMVPTVQASLRPVGGAPIPLDAGANADGVYSASGQLTRPGRWELVLERAGVREILPFIVQE
jgi:hypothetical protein